MQKQCCVLGLMVALLAGCAETSTSVALRTSLAPSLAKPFGSLVADYNKAHAGAPIMWQNTASGSDSQGEAPAWVIVPAPAAVPMANRQPFVADLAPRLLQGLVSGFRDWRQTDPVGSFLPLIGTQPLMIVDDVSVGKGLGAVPAGLGDLFRRSAEHRKKVGRYLFAPPFGVPDVVLRFVLSQGVQVLDTKGSPTYPSGELESALGPWVTAFQRGDLPKGCLDWDEAEASRQVVSGVADMTVGGLTAMAVFEARPDKSREFHLFRPMTGKVEDQWVEPIGLVHLKPGAPSLAEQNMIAFLMGKDVQVALANGYQASPLVEEARDWFPNGSKGLTPTTETYVSSMSVFVKHGMPVAPVQQSRAKVAAGIRIALVKAVAGMPMKDAIAAGQAVAEAGASDD